MTSLSIMELRQRVSELEREAEQHIAAFNSLRIFVQDIAEHGLRADPTPTLRAGTPSMLYSEWAGYFSRIDATLRERAKARLRRVDEQAWSGGPASPGSRREKPHSPGNVEKWPPPHFEPVSDDMEWSFCTKCGSVVATALTLAHYDDHKEREP